MLEKVWMMTTQEMAAAWKQMGTLFMLTGEGLQQQISTSNAKESGSHSEA